MSVLTVGNHRGTEGLTRRHDWSLLLEVPPSPPGPDRRGVGGGAGAAGRPRRPGPRPRPVYPPPSGMGSCQGVLAGRSCPAQKLSVNFPLEGGGALRAGILKSMGNPPGDWRMLTFLFYLSINHCAFTA